MEIHRIHCWHTDNGFSWTAPYEVTVNITGGAWMARSNSGVAVNMWIKGAKAINWMTLPGAQGQFMQTEWLSSNPYPWSRMISDPGGDPTVLNNVHFNAGQKIYVEGGGSDLWGMNFAVTEVVPEPSALCALSAGLVGLWHDPTTALVLYRDSLTCAFGATPACC